MNNFEYLTNLGCCPRCVLVYCGVRDSEYFVSNASATAAVKALSEALTGATVEAEVLGAGQTTTPAGDSSGATVVAEVLGAGQTTTTPAGGSSGATVVAEALGAGQTTTTPAGGSSKLATPENNETSETNGTGMDETDRLVISDASTTEVEPMKVDGEHCLEGSAMVDQPGSADAMKKETVCISCLGLLQDSCCSAAAIKQVCQPTVRAGYDAPCFSLSVCLPVSVTTRSQVIAARLSQHAGEPITKEQRGSLPPQLKDAWKAAVGGHAAAVLGKQCSAGEAPLSVPVTASYDHDAKECHAFMVAVEYAGPTLKRPRNRKQKYSYGKHKKTKENGAWDKDSSIGAAASDQNLPPSIEDDSGAVGKVVGPEYSRHAVEYVLSRLSVEEVVARCPLPPAPASPLTLIPDTPNRTSVFVAGRYRKFSRELSQTPWMIHGELKSPSSVEELIAGPIMPVLGATELKFLSSGREDVDVRCLGRGRPFALEVLNPRVASLEVAQLRQLQEKINGDTKDISVLDLQMMDKEGTSVLRYNTEDKVKNYCALCAVRDGGEPVTDALLQKLHGLTPLTVHQETPLRVLHRRPLLTRPRVVHHMTTEKVNDYFFKVHMRTEAGTYIKELVHGDFGRTTPNLSNLLGQPVDILALDVMEVELDWPPTVDDSEQ